MIREPALLVHAFCQVGDRGDEWREPVRRLWDTFRSLGEAEPIPPHPDPRIWGAFALYGLCRPLHTP